MQPLHWDAINPFTGLPFTYDDPNVRWDFYLEPGDPGFVPYGPASTPQPQKTKRMKRQNYYPSTVAQQIIWLQNFANKLGGHAPGLGVSVAECAAAIAAARWLIYVLGSWLPAIRAWQKACTEASQQAQTGTPGAVMVLPVFTAPPLPGASGGMPAVVPVTGGALNLIFDLIGEIKQSDTKTDAILTDLGVIGVQETGPDFATLQPVLKVKAVGSHTEVDWDWQGFGKFLDMAELQVNRGSGFGILAFNTTPGYHDTAPFPATPTLWKYRAIYRVNDAQTGLWSAEASVIVGG